MEDIPHGHSHAGLVIEAEDVTPNDRRNAKGLSTGVVYGISDFGRPIIWVTREAQDHIETDVSR